MRRRKNGFEVELRKSGNSATEALDFLIS